MKHITIIFLVFISLAVQAQNRILVDGKFDEWADRPIIYADPDLDGRFLGIDFGLVKMHNDDEYIFILLETGIEVNLQDVDDVTLYLDADNNVATGLRVNGIGADLIYTLGSRSGIYYGAGGSIPISHSDIGLISAPTVTSDQFEIALKRDVIIGGVPVFQSDGFKIFFRDNTQNGDILPNQGDEITYIPFNANLEALPSYSIEKPDESDLRIISYNVERDGFFIPSRQPAYRRMFQATQPDIIGFTEIYSNSSAQVADQMESILPSEPGQSWHHAQEGPDCHAISKYPILGSALIPGYNQGAGNGAFLIDLPDTESNMLLIVAHPPCCDNDIGRQTEVDLMLQFLKEAKDGNGPLPLKVEDPIVVLGDMNFVGDKQQLISLRTGDIQDETTYGPDFDPDWDGNSLLDCHPYTTGLPFSFTWYDEGSSFGPGRLDFILYSGSNLELKNGYSFFTPGLEIDSLSTHGLEASDAIVASDHLPVVADFELTNLSSVSNVRNIKDSGLLKLSPNPSFGQTELSFRMITAGHVIIQIIDPSGRDVAILFDSQLQAGEHTFIFDTSILPLGTYFIRMKTSDLVETRKMLVLR